jgi:hypothetical protein
MVQVIEHLPTKHEGLSSNSLCHKKARKIKKKRQGVESGEGAIEGVNMIKVCMCGNITMNPPTLYN